MAANGSTSTAGDGGAPPPASKDHHRGGRVTTPFIISTTFGLTLAAAGWMSNLIVFLIHNFNIERIDAAQIHNIVNGCVHFLPLIVAVAADSLLGCFPLIWISSLISLLGLILLLLTVTVAGLTPPPCTANSTSCANPSTTQYTILYSALTLVTVGVGGTRYTLATMGANQLSQLSHQSSYFDWYFFSLYGAFFVGATAIVYIEDNLSWGLGFGICIAANVLGLVIFLSGSRYYSDEPRGASPFTSMLRVVVAAVRKRKIPFEGGDYCCGDGRVKGVVEEMPTKRFSFLNRAALETEGDIAQNGSIANPWKLCTVQQVEDLKSFIRVLPLWSSSILLGTPIGVQLSITILQALASDRHVSSRFQFPASSIIVFTFISTAIGVILIDHFIRPMWARLLGKNPTPLQQIGIGHVFTVASMALSALVESKRRGFSGSHRLMPVMWLAPQMVVVGIGEAFHFPGQVGLYYQEFPSCLKSLSTAMVAMLVGVAYYLSTAVIDSIRRITDWLPDDIDGGRIDYVYWLMVVIGAVNFGYFLVISWFYEYKELEVVEKDQMICGNEA